MAASSYFGTAGDAMLETIEFASEGCEDSLAGTTVGGFFLVFAGTVVFLMDLLLLDTFCTS